MHHIDPTSGQFKAAKDRVALDTPILMLNMLRFRVSAKYSKEDQATACSGIEAYQRYSDLAFPILKSVNASMRLYSNALATMIGPQDETWDRVFVVEWPSFDVFLNTVMDPEYQKITFHRSAALDDSRLIMLENKH
ncbi:MAG: DUF1330 domain-containing protein [Gammaproteobacteria bacterium]|nr:DUF1330 domain-containing protein [Gammaproteobacteria bacterium]NNM13943.1 DUF1330 domain-containing protein [Gammaproteobacteria bacterium]